MFENHRKSRIQHCERSELRLHFDVTIKNDKNFGWFSNTVKEWKYFHEFLVKFLRLVWKFFRPLWFFVALKDLARGGLFRIIKISFLLKFPLRPLLLCGLCQSRPLGNKIGGTSKIFFGPFQPTAEKIPTSLIINPLCVNMGLWEECLKISLRPIKTF